MPRAQTPVAVMLPPLETALNSLTVDDLKWYAPVLSDSVPTRKGELVALLSRALLNPDELRKLIARLAPIEREVVAEVAHSMGGLYRSDVIEAKYPESRPPKSSRAFGSSFYIGGRKKEYAAPFDLLFAYSYDLGRYIPSDLAALLRTLLPPPEPTRMASREHPPKPHAAAKTKGPPPEVMLAETEQSVFHDLGATLYLVQQGKAAVSPATRLPTLPTLRLLRQNLLLGDYFPEEYERAEDAIRPLALIVLVQAARWAAPTTAGNKLELTRAGQALLGAPIGPQQIKEAWGRWLKSDLLDELSRVRAIKGQQAKGTRLTKPADRRARLAAVLEDLPAGRWVEMDELLRYMRAESQLPAIERGGQSGLSIGSYSSYYYGDDDGYGYSSAKYWDVIVGSYLRATLWEYVATLGLVDLAYTYPEQTPHDFGSLYYLDAEYLSRYDGLLAMRLTGLGEYVLGLEDEYTPPGPAARMAEPVLKVLPNLDVVVTDAARVPPQERAFLERIATAQSQDVYRLGREQLLDAINSGLDLAQVKQFLAARSGQAEFPPIVRVFFDDLEKRVNALREAGTMLVLEGDPFVLTELSNHPSLRALVRLGAIGEQPVLLVPEDQAATVRRQLKKLGYVPRKT
ncbi:MAG TPA: hypothetical protein VF897_03655 [Roseiflexaceae bacterium]